MKTRINNFLHKHPIMSSVFSLIAGALISWALLWILPSRDVTASNIPKKELTCTLDSAYPLITRRSSDSRLQLLYDGHVVNVPYVYVITLTNTGSYAITNEDFKDFFSIDFSGSNQLVYAQVVKPSNGAISEEVLSNARIDGTMLTITDFYLNRDESFGIYLIVDGKPDTISYHSRISDISELTLRNTPKERISSIALIGFLAIAIVIAGFIVCSIILSIKWKKREQEFMQKYFKPQQDSLSKQEAEQNSPETRC